MKVLIVTANGSAEALRKICSQAHLVVESCETVDRALSMMDKENYVAVILLFSGPYTILERMCQTLRRHPARALRVVITHNQSAIERARILQTGMDLCYIQPFYHSQLLAEICLHGYRVEEEASSPDFETQRFSLNPLMRTVAFDGDPISGLTRTEFDLLTTLLKRKGLVVSRLSLWEEVWGYQDYPITNTLDVHLNRLRKKLPTEAGNLIQTIYGVGYKMQKEA